MIKFYYEEVLYYITVFYLNFRIGLSSGHDFENVLHSNYLLGFD